MTAPQTPAGGAIGDEAPPAGFHRDWLTEEMNRQHAAGIPNLDNVGGGAIDVDRDDDACRTCGGDRFTFHTSPTNGAIELDGPCPACTGRTPR